MLLNVFYLMNGFLKSKSKQVKSLLLNSLVLFSGLLTSYSAMSAEVSISYNDKYVSEGRDNLDQGGAWWLGASESMGTGLSLSALYGVASDSSVDYDELNLTLNKDWQLGDTTLYSYYNRLEYFELNDHDNEFGIGANKSLWNGINSNVELVYNTATDGRFLVFNANKSIYADDTHQVTPHVQVGFDDGYASTNHRGYNHTSVGLTYAFKVNSQWRLQLFTEHNFVGSQIESEGRDDITWIALSVVAQL